MEPATTVLVVLAVMVGFFVKGVTGIGGPLIAIPVLAAVVGVEYAVAVIAIPTFMANCWLLWSSRAASGEVRPIVTPMLLAGILGAALGSWVLVVANEAVLVLTLAGIVIVYIVWTLIKPEFRLSDRGGRRLAAPVGLVGGWLQGTTGISAPAFGTYLHALHLARHSFVFGITLLFWVNGIVQFVSLGLLGSYNTERVVAGLVSAVPALLVLPFAMRLGDRLPVDTFRKAVLAILAVAAAILIYGTL